GSLRSGEERPHFADQALQRLAVVRRRKVEVEVAEAELEVRGDLCGDDLRRPDGLRASPAVVPRADLDCDPPRLLHAVADHEDARAEHALDLRLVAPDLLAPPAEHLVLVADDLDGAADLPRVGVSR